MVCLQELKSTDADFRSLRSAGLATGGVARAVMERCRDPARGMGPV